ncbi:MAG: hypothetical protein M1832_005485 [Thelocarpon impressellum]|nr:MAG: hypothetical protein M1832_005485 [Thelocarpon impressellum]
MAFIIIFLACTSALLAGVHAQGADFAVPSEFTVWDNEKWILSTNELVQAQYASRLHLANGYLGISLAAAGPFFEADENLTTPDGGELPINGWPLDNPRQTFCGIAGFWNVQANTTRTNFPWLLQYGGESVISGVPHWGGIIFEFGGEALTAAVDNSTVSAFTSSLSFKDGVANWSYTWAPQGANSSEFKISYTLFLSRDRPNAAAVRAEIVSSRDVTGTVTDLLDGRSAVRSIPAGNAMDQDASSIYSAVTPAGLDNITAYVFSSVNFDDAAIDRSSRKLSDQPWIPFNETTVGQTFDIALKAGEKATLFKYVGVASSDAFINPQETARNASSSAKVTGWDSLLTEQRAAWAEILSISSVDDYTDEDGRLPDDPNVRDMQISSIVSPFFLLQNTITDSARPGLDNYSITVGGISSDSYAGFVFWDADIFMSPGLVVSHPDYARTIANYRLSRADQARANAVAGNFSDGALLYPWTSSRFGNSTATGPSSQYQYHLNSDIAQMLLQHRNVTGDESWWKEEAWPVYEGVAQMFSELLQYNETTRKYEILNMTDPDEYANGINNGAFSLASASKVLETASAFRALYGMPVNETWMEIANNVAIPYDASGITLEYDGMNNSVPIKQADVVLTTYPLDYTNNYTTEQSLTDLDYYANKQSPDGPAMTYSIYSIIANEISPAGCSAYTYSLAAFQPYTRAPWYQFSEQTVDNFTENGGTNPAFPFLTGHGGFNQVGPFGWLGLRTDRQYLALNPALPPQIPQVKLRQLYYGGATLKAVMNQTHTTLRRLHTNSTFVTDIYGANPMPFTVRGTAYNISIGEMVVLENRQYSSQLTFPHNIVQCAPATTLDPFAQGQYPLAAIDGATSTVWQPSTPNKASMTIDLSAVPAQLILGLHFNWGLNPPVSAVVTLANSSTFNGEARVIRIANISISAPYDPKNIAIRPHEGNTTNVTVAATEGGVWSARYARLEIEGTQGPKNTTGATVAEFALVGSGGRDLVRRWAVGEVDQV